jgi:hypothetical protein
VAKSQVSLGFAVSRKGEISGVNGVNIPLGLRETANKPNQKILMFPTNKAARKAVSCSIAA